MGLTQDWGGKIARLSTDANGNTVLVGGGGQQYKTTLLAADGYPASPLSDWIFVEAQTLTSGVSDFTFSTIPANAKQLRIDFSIVNSLSAAQTLLTLNGDVTSANYKTEVMHLTGTGVSADEYSGTLPGLACGPLMSSYEGEYGYIAMDISSLGRSLNNPARTSIWGELQTTTPDTHKFGGVWFSSASVTSVNLRGYFGGNQDFIPGSWAALSFKR